MEVGLCPTSQTKPEACCELSLRRVAKSQSLSKTSSTHGRVGNHHSLERRTITRPCDEPSLARVMVHHQNKEGLSVAGETENPGRLPAETPDARLPNPQATDCHTHRKPILFITCGRVQSENSAEHIRQRFADSVGKFGRFRLTDICGFSRKIPASIFGKEWRILSAKNGGFGRQIPASIFGKEWRIQSAKIGGF